MVFDLTSRSSFDKLEVIYDQILRVKETNFVPMVVVGNKCDLPMREVSDAEIQTVTHQWGVPYFEASALTRKNIDESFFQLVREVRKERMVRNSNYPKRKSNPIKKHRPSCSLL